METQPQNPELRINPENSPLVDYCLQVIPNSHGVHGLVKQKSSASN